MNVFSAQPFENVNNKCIYIYIYTYIYMQVNGKRLLIFDRI